MWAHPCRVGLLPQQLCSVPCGKRSGARSGPCWGCSWGMLGQGCSPGRAGRGRGSRAWNTPGESEQDELASVWQGPSRLSSHTHRTFPSGRAELCPTKVMDPVPALELCYREAASELRGQAGRFWRLPSPGTCWDLIMKR